MFDIFKKRKEKKEMKRKSKRYSREKIQKYLFIIADPMRFGYLHY